MNYIDIILGILLLIAAINGFRKGLIAEVASLAALILGIFGAIKFSYITSDFLVEKFDLQTDYLNIISFAVTFVVIVILIHLLGKIITKIADTIMLGFVNKMAGFIFGILRAALILSIVLVVFNKIDEDMEILSPSTKENSRMYEPIRSFAPTIFPFIDKWEIDLNRNQKNNNTHVV